MSGTTTSTKLVVTWWSYCGDGDGGMAGWWGGEYSMEVIASSPRWDWISWRHIAASVAHILPHILFMPHIVAICQFASGAANS